MSIMFLLLEVEEEKNIFVGIRSFFLFSLSLIRLLLITCNDHIGRIINECKSALTHPLDMQFISNKTDCIQSIFINK